jgi:hypothetical protein
MPVPRRVPNLLSPFEENRMRPASILLTCAFACVPLAAHAQFQVPTFTRTNDAAPIGARGGVSADFNGDGWMDIATANNGPNTVAVYLNGGPAGGFLAARETAVGTGPFAIAAGDLNRDGIPDLVVTTPDNGAGTLEVLLMGRDGRASSHTIAAVGQSRGVALADVNRDGILDIVYSNYQSGAVTVLRGNGTGGFTSAGQTAVAAQPQDVVAADLNHDGFVDLLVAINSSTSLDVLYGSASGGFTRRSFYAGRRQNVLGVADIDLDGWLDVVVVSTETDRTSIMKGSASGLEMAGGTPTGNSPRSISSGDFNRDGHPDFAISNRGSNSVTVLLGDSISGSVVPSSWSADLPAGAGARPVMIDDFDHDGGVDIAVAAESAPQLSVLENSTVFEPTGFAFQRRMLRGSFVDGRTLAADFNENGQTDLLSHGVVLLDGKTSVNLPNRPDATVFDVEVGDYDRDGHTDALLALEWFDAAANSRFRGVELYRGNGHGGFAFAWGIGVDGLQALRVGDVDRDGRLDLVALAADHSGSRISVLRQAGGVPVETPLGAFASDLQLADVNRDGKIDAVVSHLDPGTIDVFLGDGTGRFASSAIVDIPFGADSVAVGDLNHDGRPDIATESGGLAFVVLQTAGGWAAPAEYSTAPPFDTPSGVLIGDFNNDGHPDLLSVGGALLPGRGDGRFGPMEPFAMLLTGGLAVDFDRDGLLDAVTIFDAILNVRGAQNHQPVARAGEDRSFVYDAQFSQDDGSLSGGESTDPDLHRLTYEWRDDTGAVFARSAEATFPPKRPGTYTFTLTVRDGRGGGDTDEIRITVTPTTEIVLHPAELESTLAGNWQRVADATAADGTRLFSPNANAPKVTAVVPNPSNYVDVSFIADPTQSYKLWVRLKAQSNGTGNDSIWMQFSGSVNAAGQPAYRIGTTSGLEVNLEECSGCGISGWGWEDDGWGAVNRNGGLLRFPDGGGQQLRIQIREDGVSVDQIVLSAVKYRTARPGSAKNDTVILPVTHHSVE